MSLPDLASLGSFVSGVAVLASLVFLFFQMRQMTEQVKQAEKNQQALISQVRSTRTVELMMGAMQAMTSETFAEAFNKSMRGEADISLAGLGGVIFYWRANFHSWQDAFYQHSDGLLTDVAFNTFKINVRDVVRLFIPRVMWRLQRQAFGAEFVAWMDNLITQTPPATALPADNWSNAVAAERSGAPY
jgi:hypothetical protein